MRPTGSALRVTVLVGENDMGRQGGAVNWLLVIAGAMIGAPLRYLTDRTVQSRHDTLFPWGTFTVNVVGCLILGLLTGAAGAASSAVRLFMRHRACGALTTYSTFSYETLRLAEDGARFYAAADVTASVAAGLGAAFTGAALARAIWGQPSREAPRGVVASRRCR